MLDCLSEEVLLACLAPLSAGELCSVAATARRYRRAASSDVLWQKLLLAQYAIAPSLAERAARRAGSYRALFAEEAVAGRRAAPWSAPGRSTLDAFIEQGAASAADAELSPSTPGSAPVAPLAIVFLVDGSGSVTDDDFEACRSAVVQYAAQLPAGSLVGVLQFSAHVRVEVPFAGTPASDDGGSDGDGGDGEAEDDFDDEEGVAARQPRAAPAAPPFDLEAFAAAVRGIRRINGATYISTALRKAAAMFGAPECNAARRCTVLLTDGRVSAEEATLAAAEAASLAAPPHRVEHYALGVGRGVDCDALKRIIAPGATPEQAAERYLALRTLDEAEW